MRLLSEIDKAWTAGFIDGEGCLAAYLKQEDKPWVVTLVSATSTCRATVENLQSSWGLGSIYHRKEKRVNARDSFHWRVAGQQAENLVRELLPYLRTKAEQAQIFIAIRERMVDPGTGRKYNTSPPDHVLEERLELIRKLKQLKKV